MTALFYSFKIYIFSCRYTGFQSNTGKKATILKSTLAKTDSVGTSKKCYREGKTIKTMSFKALIGINSFWFDFERMPQILLCKSLMIKPYHKVFPTSPFIVLYGEDFDGDNPFSLQQFCFAVFVLFINNNISIK